MPQFRADRKAANPVQLVLLGRQFLGTWAAGCWSLPSRQLFVPHLRILMRVAVDAVHTGCRALMLESSQLRDKALASLGNVPHVLLMNKCDLSPQWEVRPERLRQLTQSGWQIQRTSAKTGEGVEQAFARLTEQMLGGIPK